MLLQSKGPEALEFLQYMCSNNINQEIGTVIHTGMLNKHGGYENDCSIVPLRDNTWVDSYTLFTLGVKKNNLCFH